MFSQQQTLGRPNNSHSLQPSPISRPTTPNPTNNPASIGNSFHQRQNHHLTPISSPIIPNSHTTPTAVNPHRPSRSPRPSPRSNPNSFSIDSTSSSEYSLSAAPINHSTHLHHHSHHHHHQQQQQQRGATGVHGLSQPRLQSVSPSLTDRKETVNINGKTMQKEILESYLLGMANPVGVGNGNGTRKGSGITGQGAVTRPPPSNQRPALDQYGLGLELKPKATDYKEKDAKRKSTSNHKVLEVSRLNSLGVSDGSGAMVANSVPNHHLGSHLSNPEGRINGIETLGRRRSRSSFMKNEDFTNHAGVGAGSFSQPLPQGTFNHYDQSHASDQSPSVMNNSLSIYKTSRQSPVPPPPPRSPRNRSNPSKNWNAVLNSSPPSSDYSQESSLHQNTFPGHSILNGDHQIENRRRSRSLSKIIAHDAAMGEQLRYTLAPPVPMDQTRGVSKSFNSGISELQDGHSLESSNPISLFKSKNRHNNPSRDSKRTRSISTSGLNLNSHDHSLAGNEVARYGHHLLVGSDDREKDSAASSPNSPSSATKSKRRSRDGPRSIQSNAFTTEMNGAGVDSSFERGALGSIPSKVNGGSGRQRSNSHCPSPIQLQQDQHQVQSETTFLTNLTTDSILSTPTTKVKSRRSVQLSPRDQNARESLKGQVGNYDSRGQNSTKRKEVRRMSDNQDFEMVETGRRRSPNGSRNPRSSPSLPPVTIANLKRVELEEENPPFPNTSSSNAQADQRLSNKSILKSNVRNLSNYDSSSIASVSTSESNAPFRPPKSNRRASTVQPLRLLSSNGVDGGLPSPSLPKSPLSMSIPFDQPPSPDSEEESDAQAKPHPPVRGISRKKEAEISKGEGTEDLETAFITHSTDIEEQKRLSSNSMRRKKRHSALSPGKRDSKQVSEPGVEVEGGSTQRRISGTERQLEKTRGELAELEEEETRAAIEAGERSAAARMTVRGRVRRTQFFDKTSQNHSQDLVSNSTIVTSQVAPAVSPSRLGELPSLSDSAKIGSDLQLLAKDSSSDCNNPHAEWLKDQERRLATDDLTSIAQSRTTEERSALSESDLESADRVRIHSATASEQGRSTFGGEGEGYFNRNGLFVDGEGDGNGDVDAGVEWEMMPSPLRQGIDSAIEMWRRSTESFRNSQTLEMGIGQSDAGVALRKLQDESEEVPVVQDDEEEGIEETTQTQIKRQDERVVIHNHQNTQNDQSHLRSSWSERNRKSSANETEPESDRNCFSAEVEEPELDQFEMVVSTQSQDPQMHHQLSFGASQEIESPGFAEAGNMREEPSYRSKKSSRKSHSYVWAPPEPSLVNSTSGTTLSGRAIPGSFPSGADALDALDQPLRLYHDRINSTSRSTITDDDSQQGIDFTTGLGLFFNPSALAPPSDQPQESAVRENQQASTNAVPLSCHDLAVLCDAAQLTISDEEAEEEDDDDDGSSVASFASAREGEDGDWSFNSKRTSKVPASWGQAAFERQSSSSSRNSVSWRTSMAFNSNSAFHSHTNSTASSDRRRSVIAQEAAASIDRRLSMIARDHHKASKQFQLASHYEEKVEEEEDFLMESNGDHLEEDREIQQRVDQDSNFEFEMVNSGKNQDSPQYSYKDPEREQVPALSRPGSISTTEDCVEIPTPSFQPVALPIEELNDYPSSQGRQDEYEYQNRQQTQAQSGPHSHLKSSLPVAPGPGPGPGDADSDPEDLRLRSVPPPVKRPSSRRWSAMPPVTSNSVVNDVEDSHLDQEQSFGSSDRQSQVPVYEKEESTAIASRRLSRRASVIRKGNERRKSVQSRKRLTALMTSMPLILVEAPNHSSWRSSLPSDQFEHLLSQFGPKEMHRQEVIWELIETEASFVHNVCGVQKVFALPLRHPDGRWINGVPSPVARLFDWLEDIFQFHSKLAVALERARSAQFPVALEVAEAILKLAPKLEVYQPYLMRFEAVTSLIEEMLRDQDNVFGEFLKMQMLRPECGSLSFSSFLLKPVQRLMKYPLFFKQLFELTPPHHPDHEATKKLYHTTEHLVRDMNNVKAREEDYATLKDLESRLQGLPKDFHIAIRERKLLRQGALCCVSLNEREQEAINCSSAPATPRSSPSISSPILTGSSRAQFDGVCAEGMSKLMPITNSEYRPLSLVGRANLSSSDPRSSSDYQTRNARDIATDPGRTSVWSNASNFSYASDASRRPSSAASQARPDSFASAVGSESSTSLYEQPQRPPPPSRQRSAGPESLSPQLYSLPSSLPSPTLSRRPSMASILLRNSSKHEKEKEREMNIQAFVFSDILMLCTLEEDEVQSKPSKSSKKNKSASPQTEPPKPQRYNVLEGVGIGRVLSVTDHSGKIADRPYLLELVVLPMRHEATSRNLSSGPTSLLLSFKPPAGEHPSFRSAEQSLSLWTRALQRSLVTSLKLVKEQSAILSPQLRGPNARTSEDSLRRKRDSILGSSLSMASRFPTHVQTAHSDWTRRSKQVTELVMLTAKAGDKTSLVGLLQSGLPFPKSPSQQDLVRAASEELKRAHRREDENISHQQYGLSSSATHLSSTSSSTSVVGDNVLDEVEEEREERKWWALRLSEVRADLETEKEIDRMVEQLRSGPENRMNYSGRVSSNSSPLLGGSGMASNRWGNVSPGGVAPLGLKNGRKVREGIKVVKSSTTPPVGLGIKASHYQTTTHKENINAGGSGTGTAGFSSKRRER